MNGDRIALIAHMRAGKDHVGKHLGVHFHHHRLAFAEPIVEMAKKMFPEEFENGAKPRKLLQWFGQTMRQHDPDVWIKHMMRRIDTLDRIWPNSRIVITDLRQPNEHAALKAAGFMIVKVEARTETRIRRMQATGDVFNPADLVHETESHIDTLPSDFTITNDTDEDGVLDQMDAILRSQGMKYVSAAMEEAAAAKEGIEDGC